MVDDMQQLQLLYCSVSAKEKGRSTPFEVEHYDGIGEETYDKPCFFFFFFGPNAAKTFFADSLVRGALYNVYNFVLQFI